MIEPLDIDAFLASLPAPQGRPPAASGNGTGTPHANGHSNGYTNGVTHANGDVLAAHREKYARDILDDECRAVAAALPESRNSQLNKSAFALGTLAGSGLISRDDIATSLTLAARSMVEPLSDYEITRTIASGLDAGMREPRDESAIGTEIAARLEEYRVYLATVRANLPPAPPPDTATHGGGCAPVPPNVNAVPGDEPDDTLSGTPDNPHRLARSLLWKRYQHRDGSTLRFWREDFWEWNGVYWQAIPRKEVVAKVTTSVEEDFSRHFIEEMIAFKMAAAMAEPGKKPGKPPVKLKVSTSLVGDVIQAITGLALMTTKDFPGQPAWIGPPGAAFGGKAGATAWNPREVLPMQNGLVHLPSLADGSDAIRPNTPLFFTSFGLPYSYSADTPQPSAWLDFLDQLWGDDHESVDTLQEWMGYLLSLDTSYQKILMLTGPRRSGKGTIIRVIGRLLGDENVATPTLSSLGLPAGLAPLVGKNAAIITDARVSGKSDTSVVIERLLAISGEDKTQIKRLYKDEFSYNLYSRIMLVTNELPNLRETSTALSGRMIYLNLTRSFYGREDHSLFKRLVPEVPGILRWAIQGWARLGERGRFIQPKSGREMAQAMEELSSPMTAFLAERCKVGGGDEFRVSPPEIFAEWRLWCASKNIEHVGTEEIFSRNLRATLPSVRRVRPRVNGERPVFYEGLRLLGPYETPDAYADGEEKEDKEDIVPF